jgi:DUF917 family protein
MKSLSLEALDSIALGAAVLGAGGGGDPYIGKLMAIQALSDHGPIHLMRVDEVPDDAWCVAVGSMGAPTVAIEKLAGGGELIAALRALEARLGRPFTHLASMEVGGMNSMLPIVAAAITGLPLVDCDGMGRAFPELQMCTPTIFGIAASPMVAADDKGNAVVVDAVDNAWTERLARSATIDMGAISYIALYPQTGAQLKESMIPNTLALAKRIGDAIVSARSSREAPAASVAAAGGGFVLFDGKVADLRRTTVAGFARGTVWLEGSGNDTDVKVEVHFQNENLIALRGTTVLASSPDLIVILETDSGQPITTEDLRYGNRITLISLPCDPRWRTAAGLRLVGPRYFGFDVEYTPIEELAGGK